ncbi:MAG: leucine-rich repeat domain-containing protein [Verrucomicrobiales bacterium]
MKSFLCVLGLAAVLGGCSKAPVVETNPVEGSLQEAVEENQNVEPSPKQSGKVIGNPNLWYVIEDGTVQWIHTSPSELRADKSRMAGLRKPLVDSDLWYVVEDGTVRIIENRSGLAGLSNPGFRLPERIDGKPVTSIGPKAYAGCNQAVFIIPDTVTGIEEQAFASCYGLKEVKIGKNVTNIGKAAFAFSMPLKSITIPSRVVNIGEEAFLSCRTLANITIHEGVSSIGKEAFANTYVRDITIPKSIKRIGKDSFHLCSRLTSVTFLGDAPEEVGRVFPARVIICRRPEAKGWGETWGRAGG